MEHISSHDMINKVNQIMILKSENFKFVFKYQYLNV